MLGVVLLVQQIEGHVLQPLVMGTAVKVHPLAVVLSVVAFSASRAFRRSVRSTVGRDIQCHGQYVASGDGVGIRRRALGWGGTTDTAQH